MAPEAIDNLENDELSDIWSLGCLLYQLVLGIPPYVAGSEYLIFLRVKHRDLQFPVSFTDENMKNQISGILQLDRSKRPCLEELLSVFPDTVGPRTSFDQFISEINMQPDVVQLARSAIDSQQRTPNPDEYVIQRLQCLLTVIDWEERSKPGAGTAMVDHLDVPELRRNFS